MKTEISQKRRLLSLALTFVMVVSMTMGLGTVTYATETEPAAESETQQPADDVDAADEATDDDVAVTDLDQEIAEPSEETEETTENIVIEKASGKSLSNKGTSQGNDEKEDSPEVMTASEDDGVIDSGECGSNLTYKITQNADGETKTLTIQGSGAMTDYTASQAPWYSNKAGITKVSLPEGLTHIGNYAFYTMTDLKEAAIPSTVTSIGSQAFRGTGITSINFPSGLTSIGTYAFYGTALTEVTLPGSLGAGIGTYAFYNCTALTKATLLEGITTLSASIFRSCINLEEVVIPQGVTTINTYAFYGCSKLTQVSLPGTVTTIGSSAFGATVTDIYFDGTKDQWPSVTLGANTVVHFKGDPVLNGIIAPSAITGIINGTPKTVKGLKLPETVAIDVANVSKAEAAVTWDVDSASYDPSNTAEQTFDVSGTVTLPEGVTNDNNIALKVTVSVTVMAEMKGECGAEGDNLTYILKINEDGETCTLTITGTGKMVDYTTSSSTRAPWYDYGSRITSVSLPSGLTYIGSYAFYGCSGLKSVDVPESVTDFGVGVFRNCTGLSEVDLPDGLTEISGSLFYGCKALTGIELPAKLTTIGTNAFTSCTNLAEITIPDSVTSLGSSAFYECSNLTKVNIPDGIPSIGASTFRGCSKLTEVKLPESVTEIGAYAFYACTSLTNVNIPEKVTSIGNYAFYGNKNMTGIKLPDGLTALGTNVFRNCASLTEVNIPKGITTLGQYTFDGCSGLEKVTFSEGLTTIDNYSVFADCTSLTELDLPDSLTSIGGSAFSGCTNLKRVKLSDNITTIGAEAFYNCTSLTSIEIPKKMTVINAVFSGCTGLTEVTVPEGVTTLTGTFNNCSNLATVNLPSTLTSIGNNAFNGCTALKDIYYPLTEKEWDAHVTISTTGNDVLAGEGVTYHFAAPTNLISITQPEAITGIANGSAKTVKDLQLPATVAIAVEDESVTEADITWDVDNADYNEDEVKEQTFEVKGTVELPLKIANPDNINLELTITVTVEGAPYTGAPKASVEPGTYEDVQFVNLENTTAGATIYYTTDGSDPTEESAEYTGTIEVTGEKGRSVSTTIKAIAMKDGMQNSEMTVLEYVIEIPEDAYVVEIAPGDYGMAVSDYCYVTEGTKVTLTAMPDAGYRFVEWEVLAGDITIEDDSFIMPASDVTIRAIFEEAPVSDPDEENTDINQDGPDDEGDITADDEEAASADAAEDTAAEDSAKTGDESNIALALALMILAAGGAAGTALCRRRNN